MLLGIRTFTRLPLLATRHAARRQQPKSRFLSLESMLSDYNPGTDTEAVSPSTKTTVILKNIGLKTTIDVLKKALDEKKVLYRKCQLEPGCAMHLISEAAADLAASELKNKLGLKSVIHKVSMPAILVKNLPIEEEIEQLRALFGRFKPKYIRIIGDNTLLIYFSDPKKTLLASKLIETVTVSGRKLTTHVVKVHPGKFLVEISNLPPEASIESVKSIISEKLSSITENTVESSSIFNFHEAAKPAVVIRLYDDKNQDVSDTTKQALQDALLSEKIDVEDISISVIKKPALFIRKIEEVTVGAVTSLMKSHGAIFVREIMRSKLVHSGLAVAYFPSEQAAMEAKIKLKGVSIEGKKASITYKEVFEPAVKLSNLPPSCDKDRMMAYLESRHIYPVCTELDANKKEAILTFAGLKDAEVARMALSEATIDDKIIKSASADVGDVSIKVTLKNRSSIDSSLKVVQNFISDSQSFQGSVSLDTNRSAFIAFESLKEVHVAQSKNPLYLKSILVNPNNTSTELAAETARPTSASSHLSLHPSYVVEVSGLSEDTPAVEVVDAVTGGEDGLFSVFRLDRNALVKFTRNKHVLSGMKLLSEVRLDGGYIAVDEVADNADATSKSSTDASESRPSGIALKPTRYKTLVASGATSYDMPTGGNEEVLDRFSLHMLLKDYMHSDPGTRYQLARNYFERALNDALATNDSSYLIKKTSSKQIRSEAQFILAKSSISEADEARLFELYIQSEDVREFTHDFDEMTTLLGAANPADPWSWSEFVVDDEPQVERVSKAKQIDDKEARKAAIKGFKLKARDNTEPDILDGAVPEDIIINDEALEKMAQAYRNRSQVTDTDVKGSVEDLFASWDGQPPVTNDDKAFQSESSGDEPIRNAQDTSVPPSQSDAFDNDFKNMETEAEEKSNFKGYKKKEAKERERKEREERRKKEEEENHMNPTNLVDRKGHVWSGAILDTDMVSKTMPGNRMQSHRALVVIGNLKGVGGLGTAKGKTSDEAIQAAFRDALRNLVFIDLYDNFGLAHDVYGKHNACHAIIRATPRARESVGSPFASAILECFGISSYSCKLVGRRNPYSQARAIFNAVAKHQNLDEYAKARGKRYLTLKYMYDRNV